MSAYTYILKCGDGSYYVGSTTNILNRLKKHENGSASKYTTVRQPVKLVFYERVQDIKVARKREIEIKGWSRLKKEKLIISKNWQHDFAIGCYAFIVNKQGELLLMQHCDRKVWMLPGGGLNAHESLVECVKREAFEEMGLKIKVEKLLLTHQKINDSIVVHVFEAHITEDIAPFSPTEEASDIRFFALSDLPKSLAESSLQRIQAILNKQTLLIT